MTFLLPSSQSDLEKTLASLPHFKASWSLRLLMKLRFRRTNGSFWGQFSISPFMLGLKSLSVASFCLLLFGTALTSYAYHASGVNPTTPVLGALKLASENMQLALAEVDARATLKASFAQRRVEELSKVLSNGSVSSALMREASYNTTEALSLAKQGSESVKVSTAKSIAKTSNQAVETVAVIKEKLLTAKATDQAKSENLPEEVIRQIEFRAAGIQLGPSAVASNKEPSLTMNAEEQIRARNFYILPEDMRSNDPVSEEETPTSIDSSSLEASRVLSESAKDPEIVELENFLEELKETSDPSKLVSSLGLATN